MAQPSTGTTDVPLTQTRLIRAAARRLWERSFNATGVDELCRLAGAKKGSFYYFFASKTALALAAIELNWASIRYEVLDPISREGDPGLGRFHRLIERMYRIQQEAQKDEGHVLGCPFGNIGQEMAAQDDQIREAVQVVFDGHCRYLQRWLDEAVTSSDIPAGDTATRARQLFALFEGALLLAKVANSPDVFRQAAAAALAIATTAPRAARAAGTAPELL
jgi:TetR/AcrR family transcriptional repressor of nem operon